MDNLDINIINPVTLHASYYLHPLNQPDGKAMNKREAKYYEIDLITESGGWINTQGEDIAAIKGDIFLRAPGMVVQGYYGYSAYLLAFDITYNDDNICMYDNIDIFNQEGNTLNTKYDIKLPYKINFSDFNKYEKLFNNVYKYMIKREPSYEIMVKSNMMQLLCDYIYASKNIEKTSTSRLYSQYYQSIMNTKKYIQNNLSNTISLDDLSSIANLSRNFFCKVFKTIMGKSAFDYINQERINLAQQYLITSTLSIDNISIKCGYNDKSYFYRHFNKHVGETPLQYRTKAITQYK